MNDRASTASRRIVLLSSLRVFPPFTGGHLHTAGIARALARMGHRVTLFAMAGRREDYGAGTRLLRSEIEPSLVEEVHLGFLIGLLQALFRRLGVPRIWLWWLLRRGWIPARLKTLLQEADCVFCDLPICTVVPGPWTDKPWFLISHNLEYRLLEQGSPRERRFAGWMRRLEDSAPQRYRDIFACAEEDQRFFRERDSEGRCAIPLVGSAVDPAEYVVEPGTRERVRAELGVTEDETLIVFSGSRFQPNLDALASLKEFARREAVFLEGAKLRFLILGTIESAPYREGALIATGRVAAIPPYFAAADAGLNPVTWGSGANVKLFEYLAARLPVIATRIGVRGTELVTERDYLEMEPAEFRSALERLIRERDRAAWRAFAEDVWARHRHYCDIVEVTHTAARALRGIEL